jgi:hypothetical protein
MPISPMPMSSTPSCSSAATTSSPDADRAERLVVRHRGACRHVVRPGSDRYADQRRRSRPDRRDGAGDAGIDHADSGADPRGKHVDRRTTARKFATICGVTSAGYADTPWRTTPWSAAATTIARRL